MNALPYNSFFAKKRGRRPDLTSMYAWASGSRYEMWLQATRSGPSSGMCSLPSNRQLNHMARMGRRVSSRNRYQGSGLATLSPGRGARLF